MAYAFVQAGVVQAVVPNLDGIDEMMHDLYILIPPELEAKVHPKTYTYANGVFTSFDANMELNSDIVSKARMERDVLLTATDRYMLPDYPIDADKLSQVKAYRTALRNFPETIPKTINKYSDVTFPEMPNLTSTTTSSTSTTTSGT